VSGDIKIEFGRYSVIRSWKNADHEEWRSQRMEITKNGDYEEWRSGRMQITQ